MYNTDDINNLSNQFIQDILNKFTGIEFIKTHPIAHALTINRKFVFLNQSAISLFDANDASQLLRKDITSFIHPLDHGRILERLEKLNEYMPRNPPTEQRLYALSGNVKRIISTSTFYQIDNCDLVMTTGVEITEAIGYEISESEKNFQRLFENMLDVFYRTDKNQLITLIGPAVQQVTGYQPEEVIGMRADYFYVNPEIRKSLIEVLKKEGSIKNFHSQLKHKNGMTVDVEISSKAIYSPEGQFLGIEGVFRDISEQIMIKRQLEHLAQTDELTGILNRRSFIELGTRIVKQLRRKHECNYLIIFDLDKFKAINDTYGHLNGDKVLVNVVNVIIETLRETDIFGRLGGDEFAIIARNCSAEESYNMLDRILDSVQNRIILMSDGTKINIYLSIGLTHLTNGDLPLSVAMARADRQLYQAKNRGGACYVVENNNQI
ncbi:PAS domain S-box protein [Acidithiobacillus ferridurans]|uniref:GGDEF domain-containing protein n=1 Tax=Acidithiobacillus ferridurans TaxID=1232575 RepID=UPI000DE31281|nr:GGDEF domain-containing protein [Acidithiobacillus ferridurans]RBM03680.1 PAS domain S-box protein [Acidithiobacillus ferridurans]